MAATTRGRRSLHAAAQIVTEYMKLMGAKMDEDLAETVTELDGRFQTVRLRERCVP